jgi:hypothetical protein
MSAEIVNLRLARKRRDRAAKEEEAARNRRLHGETKAVREEWRLSAAKAARDLDAHRREASAAEPAARNADAGESEDRT